jgi:heme/copper-type cytochrome/quinol oxidase subunit 2
VSQPQLNLLAGISVAVCWVAFAATWRAAENWNESRAPAERTRSWFGTAVLPGAVVITVILLAVPKAELQSALRTSSQLAW